MLNAILFIVNQADLIKSLNILWKGLLAIVVVVGIVMIVTAIMQKISYRAADKKKAEAAKSDPNKTDND